MDYKQPTPEQFKDIMDSYRFMLQELEQYAQDDKVLRHFVKGFYNNWNDVSGKNHKPHWKD